MKFKDVKIIPWLTNALKSMRITQPLLFKLACITFNMKVSHVVGSARTDIGKTFEFVISVGQITAERTHKIFAHILISTLELGL